MLYHRHTRTAVNVCGVLWFHVAQVLWRSVQGSRKPIGLVLMSQELVAGIGNIYRAEILYKVRCAGGSTAGNAENAPHPKHTHATCAI